MAQVDLTHLEEEYDMRFRKAMLELPKVKRLKQGTCALFINRAQTLVRIIDWELGLHEYRSRVPGVRFSLTGIRDLMKSGLGVNLVVGKFEIKDVEQLREAA